MRHGDKINNLGRTSAHRKALLSNLACQLIAYKRINTTLAKAKALRTYVEPIITKSKNDTVHNRRLVFSKLQDKEAIKELFGTVSDKVADRPGGYTRIIKLQNRIGDAADMAMIELVDFNAIYTKETRTAGAAKKTRRKRSSGASKPVAATEAATTTPVEETATVTADTTTPEEVINEAPATETPAADASEQQSQEEGNKDA